jgi:hypothetical protein
MKPQIATILEDGNYGQRKMTDEEYANHLEQQSNSPQTTEATDETLTAN